MVSVRLDLVCVSCLQPTTCAGDSYASEGIVEFGKLIEEIHPGIFVHSVYIVDNNDDDRKATFVRLPHASMI